MEALELRQIASESRSLIESWIGSLYNERDEGLCNLSSRFSQRVC
jgi:hypothetical protein